MTDDVSHIAVPEPAEESRVERILWMVLPPAILALAAIVIGVSGGNRRLFLVLNGSLDPLGDVFWSHVTLLGDTLVVMALAVVLFRKRPDVVAALYLSALNAVPFVRGFKGLIDVLRPPGVLEAGTFHLIGPSYSHSSFPSGHTATAFAVASVIAMLICRRRWTRAIMIAVALLVGLSRVAVGVHWPLDVVVGGAIGWLAGFFGIAIMRGMTWYRRPAAIRILGATLVIAGGVTAFAYSTEYELALIAQRVIGVACFGWGIREFVMTWRDARAVGTPPPSPSDS
jgi:membrane-associated phospholipid phosphatase